MSTASVYKSRYRGGDGVWRRTRFDGGYVVIMLGGKEMIVRNKNVIGSSLKFSFMGPAWHQPVDEEASYLRQDIVYHESAPFSYRFSNLETATDLTVTYRINREKRAVILALKLKNLIVRQYQGKVYNLTTATVEDEFFNSIVPFLSYKLEFLGFYAVI